MSGSPKEILRKARLVVAAGTFHVVSLGHESWQALLADPDRSPRAESQFLIFKDGWEVTIVVDDKDFLNLRPGLDNARFESGFRLLSFDAEMDFDVVGFMAAVSSILADAGISILPISSFKRDHVLVRQEDLAGALKAFRGIVDEVC